MFRFSALFCFSALFSMMGFYDEIIWHFAFQIKKNLVGEVLFIKTLPRSPISLGKRGNYVVFFKEVTTFYQKFISNILHPWEDNRTAFVASLHSQVIFYQIGYCKCFHLLGF
jgi:hypothetical protein